MWEAIPPRIEAISPIGAGDAMAAAVLWSIENGDDFRRPSVGGGRRHGLRQAARHAVRHPRTGPRRSRRYGSATDRGMRVYPARARWLLRSAGIVSAAVAVSRITGLVRESVLSWLFGAGAVFDAYAVGYRIANLARDLFAEGALSSAFVPTFTRYLTTKTSEEARELSNITATLLIAIVGVCVRSECCSARPSWSPSRRVSTPCQASSNWPPAWSAPCSPSCCWSRCPRRPRHSGRPPSVRCARAFVEPLQRRLRRLRTAAGPLAWPGLNSPVQGMAYGILLEARRSWPFSCRAYGEPASPGVRDGICGTRAFATSLTDGSGHPRERRSKSTCWSTPTSRPACAMPPAM